MLQRIQSLYLFVVVIALSLMFFFPVAVFNEAKGNIYEFFIYGFAEKNASLKTIAFNWTSIVMVSILMANALITIFLFKRRLLQVRLSILNLFMMTGSIFLLWFNISSQAALIEADVRYMIPMIIPILSIVLTFLAIRAIGKDEALIKSMDRIR